MGAENREVRVVALFLLVGVSVHHGQIVIVILLTDKAAGVLAERANLVLKGPGIAHQLRFVEHPVHGLHDLVADLHANADVHSTGCVGDVVLRAELFQPVRAPAAGGHHGVLGVNFQIDLAVGHGNAPADVLLQNQVAALIAEVHLHAMLL